MDALGIWGGDWRSRAAHRTEWPFPPWALRREPERVFGEPLQQCRHVSRWDKPQELGGERPNHIRLELVPSFSHVFTYYLSTYQFLRYIDILLHRYISASFLHLFYIFLFQTPAVNVNHWLHPNLPKPIEVQTHPLRGLTSEAADVSWQLLGWMADLLSVIGMVPSLKLTVRTWKWMVGILVSFWDGLFSGAMLNFREGKITMKNGPPSGHQT